jgi:hypothetical protein
MLDHSHMIYSHLSKVFGNVENPYIINQNHMIFVHVPVCKQWMVRNIIKITIH